MANIITVASESALVTEALSNKSHPFSSEGDASSRWTCAMRKTRETRFESV